MDVPVVAATFLTVVLAPVIIVGIELFVLIPQHHVPRRLLKSLPTLYCAAFMVVFLGVGLPSFIARTSLPAAYSSRTPVYTPEQLVANGWTPLEAYDADGDLIDASYVQLGARRQKIMLFLPGKEASYGSSSMLEAAARIADAADANLVGLNYGRRLGKVRSKFKGADSLVHDANRVLRHVLTRFLVEEKDVVLYGRSLGGGVVSGIACEGCTYVVDRTFHAFSRAAAWLCYRVVSILVLVFISIFSFLDGLIHLGNFELYNLVPAVFYSVLAGIGFFISGRLPGVGPKVESEFVDVMIMAVLWMYSLFQFAVVMPRSLLRRTIGFEPNWIFFRNVAFVLAAVVVAFDVTSGVMEITGFEMRVTDNLILKCNQGSTVVVMHAGWRDVIVPERANTATYLRKLEMLQLKCFNEIEISGVGHNELYGRGFDTSLRKLGEILNR